MIASRGGKSAMALAAALAGTAAAVTDPVAVAPDVDVIISCTNSAATVLGAAEVAAMQERRGHRPLTIVDIAVPRDVEACGRRDRRRASSSTSMPWVGASPAGAGESSAPSPRPQR